MSLGSLENPPMNPSPQGQKHFSAEIINSVNIFFNFTFYHKPVILVIILVKSLSIVPILIMLILQLLMMRMTLIFEEILHSFWLLSSRTDHKYKFPNLRTKRFNWISKAPENWTPAAREKFYSKYFQRKDSVDSRAPKCLNFPVGRLWRAKAFRTNCIIFFQQMCVKTA